MIPNSPCDALFEPLLISLKLPSVDEIVDQESTIMVYKTANNQATMYLNTLFNRVSSVTNRFISSPEVNLRPPRQKQNMDKTVLHAGGHGLQFVTKRL